MGATGRVRDRAKHGRAAAMGVTILWKGLGPGAKWWGPVVLDAAPKPPSSSDLSRESPPPLADKPSSPQTIFLQSFDLRNILPGGDQRPTKGMFMARSKVSARDALLKVQRQREELAAEETKLREGVAAELGKVLLECGAETLEPAQVRQLIRQSMAIGIDESLKRLASTPKPA